MNERMPTNETEILDMDKGPDGVWRMLEKEAPSRVDELMGSIEGFEHMLIDEKISALKDLLAGITDKNDRFVLEPLSKNIRALEVYRDYVREMEGLGVEIGGIINEKV